MRRFYFLAVCAKDHWIATCDICGEEFELRKSVWNHDGGSAVFLTNLWAHMDGHEPVPAVSCEKS